MIRANAVVSGDCLGWLDCVESGSVDLVYIDPPFFTQRNFGDFDDRWDSMDAYIEWMRLRVQELHRILKPTGSILLHCDWHASHRLRVMLDDVFGEQNFINEIVWVYKSGGATNKRFARKHDNIYFYSKSKKFTYNQSTERSYMRKGSGKNPAQTYYEDDNGIYTLVNGKDWMEFGMLATSSKERLGCKTQKPEPLIKKLIKSCSNKNDVILDCFGGSGTTGAVAYKLGRRFIVGDKSVKAVNVTRRRLSDLGAKFVVV